MKKQRVREYPAADPASLREQRVQTSGTTWIGGPKRRGRKLRRVGSYGDVRKKAGNAPRATMHRGPVVPIEVVRRSNRTENPLSESGGIIGTRPPARAEIVSVLSGVQRV